MISRTVLCLLLALPAGWAAAEEAVDAQSIVEALKPQGQRARTRNIGIMRAEPPAPAQQLLAPAPLAPVPPVAPDASSAAVLPDPPAPSLPTAPATQAQPAAAATPGQEAALSPEGAQISLAIAFAFNSARLTPEGAKVLDQLGLALASEQLAGLRFRVEGHTDGKGSAVYNRKLSQARAEEVRRYLMFAHGVEGERLLAVGKGASELANPADPLAAENRRVRVVTLGD